MTLGRRPLFFLAVGLVSLLLFIPTPSDYRWVNVVMAGISFFWFVMLGIEERQGSRFPTGDPPAPSAPSVNEREDRS